VVGRVRQQAGEVEVVEAAVFLSGADFPSQIEALDRAVAAAAWAPRSRVDNDTVALLRAGTAATDAVAVVCGTGINAVGVASDGRIHRFPAVGRISGDWGGGTDLALEALWHAARAEDGRGPETSLRTAVPQQLGYPRVVDVSEAFELRRASVADLRAVTPVLFAEAAAGDRVAAASSPGRPRRSPCSSGCCCADSGCWTTGGDRPGRARRFRPRGSARDAPRRHRPPDLGPRRVLRSWSTTPRCWGRPSLALDRLAGSTTPVSVADRVRSDLAGHV
jgi:hypothetical protein